MVNVSVSYVLDFKLTGQLTCSHICSLTSEGYCPRKWDPTDAKKHKMTAC